MSDTPEPIRALRYGVALSRMDHVRTFRVSGLDAFEVMDALCPRALFLHDCELFQSLFLNDDGSPLADVVVGCDDEAYLVFAETRDPEVDLLGWMQDRAPAGHTFELRELTREHTHLALNGPWAWELLAELLGPEVVGLPYLSFFETPWGRCLRAGKTGEYGYELLVSPEDLGEVEERLREAGRPFDLCEADLEALDLCALENWFFNIRREGACEGVTPLELQLQWRLSRDKPYVGQAAVDARREEGLQRRLIGVSAGGGLEAGDALYHDDAGPIGEVVNAAWSPLRGERLGLALVDLAWSWPGLDGVRVGEGGEGARFVSAPFLNNRSLYVKPQKHRYATRGEDTFPPTVMP